MLYAEREFAMLRTCKTETIQMSVWRLLKPGNYGNQLFFVCRGEVVTHPGEGNIGRYLHLEHFHN